MLVLHKLFMCEQKGPLDWRRSLTVKIPKEGSLTMCDNYRGIFLLPVPSKIFCRIQIDRIKQGVDERLYARSSLALGKEGNNGADIHTRKHP